MDCYETCNYLASCVLRKVFIKFQRLFTVDKGTCNTLEWILLFVGKQMVKLLYVSA